MNIIQKRTVKACTITGEFHGNLHNYPNNILGKFYTNSSSMLQLQSKLLLFMMKMIHKLKSSFVKAKENSSDFH